MSKRRNGFTLVELLVVISIIALLLSILMPSLGKARSQAKSVRCMANLRQLALCYSMYTGENKGFFESGIDDVAGSQKTWVNTLQPYYGKVDELRCCPETPEPKSKADVKGYEYGTSKKYWVYNDEYGSYTINCWTSNPAFWPATWGVPVGQKGLWRSSYQKGTNNIPVIADGLYMGSLPMQFDKCSRYPDMMDNVNSSMQRHCINRHYGGVNVAFMDWSVRRVGLKALWKLKWHRLFDISGSNQIWPAWISKY